MRRQVQDIAFEPDGAVIISFISADDIRCDGNVAVRRTMRIEPTDQYMPDIERLVGRANALLNDALEDWAGSDAVPDELLGPPVPGQEPPLAPTPDDGDEDDANAERNMRAIEESRGGGQALD